MKEKIDFLLNKRQKIWFKEGAASTLNTVFSGFRSFLLAVILLWVWNMLLTCFFMMVSPLERQSEFQKIIDMLLAYHLYAAIILSFFVIKFINVILEKRSLLSEDGACIEMIELVEKSKEARTYRDGVVSAGLPLLKYDLEKVKEIISETEKLKADNERKMLCQKAHGIEGLS